MYAVHLRRGLFAENATLTVRVVTHAGTMRFLGKFSEHPLFGSEVPTVGESVPVYDWYECWFEDAKPIANIVRET
jgi:hypothetical protein